MAVTFRKYKDSYYINNNTDTVITYRISLKQGYCGCGNSECCEYKEILIGAIPIYTEYSLLLPNEGEYKIETKPNLGNYTTLVIFNKYLELTSYLATKIKLLICDNCCSKNKKTLTRNHCITEGLEKLLECQNIFNLLNINIFLNKEFSLISKNSTLENYFLQAMELYKCNLIGATYCQKNSSDFLGKASIDLETFKNIALIQFLGLYFRDYADATDAEYRLYVDNLYNICEIKHCMRNLEVSYIELRDIFIEQAGIFDNTFDSSFE